MSQCSVMNAQTIRRAVRAAVVLAAIAVCVVTTGCASTGVTSARLETSIAPTFTRLYTWQQKLEGKPSPGHMNTHAQCIRGLAGDKGAGPDWACTIQYFENPSSPVSFSYDVTVKPDGCWSAENGPPSLGALDIRTKQGKLVPNPVYMVDGCFRAT